MTDAPKTILYMEDDRGLCELFKKRMTPLGYATQTAQSGEQGLELYNPEHHSIVIVDYHLPGVNGIEVLQALLQRNENVPVIMLTGNGDETIAVKVLKLGAIDYVVKDTNLVYFELLPDIIDAALFKQRLVTENKRHQEELHYYARELELANQQMQRERDKAESANITKSQFLINMSHEIRTPINAVVGLTNILLGSSIDARQREYLNTLKLSADALLELINDLLDVARFEAGQVKLEVIPFNLVRLIQQVIELMSHRAKEKNIEIFFYYNPSIPMDFTGDPLRIRQILVNLLSNAVKFTERGSVVVQLTGDTTQSGMHASAMPVSIQVKDSGIGIEVGNLEHIFDKFMQADPSITRKYGGSGLGLSICRQVVELLGGSIQVESELGKGACFTVSLKLAVNKVTAENAVITTHNSAKGSQQAALLSANENSATSSFAFIAKPSIAEQEEDKNCPTAHPIAPIPILLVEDYKPSIMVATIMLKSFGYEVDVACDGAQAVEKYTHTNRPYHLVIMDVQMPVMDGFQATRRIRQIEQEQQRPYTPIIAMTAHALLGYREKCLEVGMDEYIAKPFDPTDLQQKMQRLLRAGEVMLKH